MERITKVFGNTVNRVGMFKKSLLLTLAMCLLFSSFADAKRRYKRSYHRSQTHYYHRYNNTNKADAHSSTRGIDYFGPVNETNMKQGEEQDPVIQKETNKLNNKASRIKKHQSDVQPKASHQEKKNRPTCAPLHMAHQLGYTNLPICADGEY
ncbi:TPA: hypothetical protein ACYQNV_002890 [Escherichia coli]|uniref:hypothetical protein n=1 Tax=Escherichia coli TaxID=562 RepID=UPI00198499EA|nr:hypothetical protein [Escherichia coli]HAN3964728.1 hypothetical protein [Escherichia coli]HBE4477222.1 hypothetical protein [Escherichia coli]HBE5625299.1 hypothetical protein [Escherichia coli]